MTVAEFKGSVIESRVAVEMPGVVTANAYCEVKVAPLVGGIVRKVQAELGTVVKPGAPLATLLSTELANAEAKYLSMRATVETDHQRLERTQQLVDIGAASRQERDIYPAHGRAGAAGR